MRGLGDGGIDDGGSYVEYVFEGRREQGWVYRLLRGDLVQIETFSGDYVVMHHVRRTAIRHVFTAEELAKADRAAGAQPRRR
ncbi:MAG: hypothetical protein K8T90_08035 [Planctomycetes bacterium]|nr:hypothetical protein [Planctomycetota bacterium]